MKLRKLTEEFADAKKKKDEYYEIFRNPSMKELNEVFKTIDEADSGLRGLMTINGTLYVISPAMDLIHQDIMEILSEKGYTRNVSSWEKAQKSESQKYFLEVITDDNNIKSWRLAESYLLSGGEKPSKEYLIKYKDLFAKKGFNLITEE